MSGETYMTLMCYAVADEKPGGPIIWDWAETNMFCH